MSLYYAIVELQWKQCLSSSACVVWLCEGSNSMWCGCVTGQCVVWLCEGSNSVWLCEGSNSVWCSCVRDQTVCGVIV